jgi:hypothetical protein
MDRANKNCKAVCSAFDDPESDGKPHAMIFITPLIANHRHPIGTYFLHLKKSSIFNLDGIAMVAGAICRVKT